MYHFSEPSYIFIVSSRHYCKQNKTEQPHCNKTDVFVQQFLINQQKYSTHKCIPHNQPTIRLEMVTFTISLTLASEIRSFRLLPFSLMYFESSSTHVDRGSGIFRQNCSCTSCIENEIKLIKPKEIRQI